MVQADVLFEMSRELEITQISPVTTIMEEDIPPPAIPSRDVLATFDQAYDEMMGDLNDTGVEEEYESDSDLDEPQQTTPTMDALERGYVEMMMDMRDPIVQDDSARIVQPQAALVSDRNSESRCFTFEYPGRISSLVQEYAAHERLSISTTTRPSWTMEDIHTHQRGNNDLEGKSNRNSMQ